jgi:hypothetical protein
MQHMSAAAQNRLGLLLEPSMSVMSASRSPPRAWCSTVADRKVVDERSKPKPAACRDHTSSTVTVDIGDAAAIVPDGSGEAKSDSPSTSRAEGVDAVGKSIKRFAEFTPDAV